MNTLSIEVLAKIGRATGDCVSYGRLAYAADLRLLADPWRKVAIESFTQHTIEFSGTQEWRLNGERHREGDKPAIIYADGVQEWWLNGVLHREGGQPAVVYPGGTQEWWLNGKRHREGDQPAIIYFDGRQEWWLNGKRQR